MARLSHAKVSACRFSESAVVSFDLDVCGASCLASHLRFTVEENAGDMVAWFRLSERAWWDSPVYRLVTKWFLSTRLETRTKESNACVSFWVVKLCGVLKEIVGMFAPATNQTIV